MTNLWGPIAESEWRDVPHVSGRVATEADVIAGRAVFYIEGESGHDPMPVPCCAVQLLDDGSEQRVVVIQSEIAPFGRLRCVRPLAGGNCVCSDAELRLLPDGFDAPSPA